MMKGSGGNIFALFLMFGGKHLFFLFLHKYDFSYVFL